MLVTPILPSPYVERGYWVEGYADNDVPALGKSGKAKRRWYVEIDGENIPVESATDAIVLLDLAKKEAEQMAEKALERAISAKVRQRRKAMQDAKKTLLEPTIQVAPDIPADVQAYAKAVLDQIRERFRQTLQSIEIALRMRDLEAQLQQDDEEVLMMML